MELSKGEKTKLLILESAIKLLKVNGYENLSYQKIADDIGLSQSAVIKHFPSKSVLFTNMRSLASQSNQKWIQSKLKNIQSGIKQLEIYAYETANWALLNPSYAELLHLGYYYSKDIKELQKMNLSTWKNSDKRISSFLNLAIEQNEISKEIPMESTSKQFHFWVTGMAIRCFVTGRSSLKPLKKEISQFLKLILD